MSPTTVKQAAPQDPRQRGRVIGFLNWGHLLDHYVLLIYPTVVLGLEAVYNRPYGDLLMLSTAAFTVFGLLALPCGWIAEQALGVTASVLTGQIVNFPEEPETVQENIREIGPSVMLAAPRIWENLVSQVTVKMTDRREYAANRNLPPRTPL